MCFGLYHPLNTCIIVRVTGTFNRWHSPVQSISSSVKTAHPETWCSGKLKFTWEKWPDGVGSSGKPPDGSWETESSHRF